VIEAIFQVFIESKNQQERHSQKNTMCYKVFARPRTCLFGLAVCGCPVVVSGNASFIAVFQRFQVILTADHRTYRIAHFLPFKLPTTCFMCIQCLY